MVILVLFKFAFGLLQRLLQLDDLRTEDLALLKLILDLFFTNFDLYVSLLSLVILYAFRSFEFILGLLT